MLARQRQALILREVRGAGSARVSELTLRLGVSDMTIRRDLEVLARAGLIDKVHGGAVLPGAPSSHEPGFETKSTLEQAAKAAIAAAAAELVTPGRPNWSRRAARSACPPAPRPSRWRSGSSAFPASPS
jgi:DeoR/GlpR family transcriptional regulator of sugar metabolism